MRPLLVVAGWIAAAVAAISIGLVGVRAIGDGITDDAGNDVLSAEEAARELAAARPPGSGPSPVPSASPSGDRSSAPPAPPEGPVNQRVFTGPGGTVRAGCLPAGAVLVTWTPAQGYGIKESRKGPGEYAEVRFDRGGGGKGRSESRVRIRCVGGVPVDDWN